MSKEERRKRILELIAAQEIRNQSDIVRHLTENGYAVTQASVSRDLDELGVDKRKGSYRIKEPSKLLRFGNVTLSAAGDALIVARCSPGLASALAVKVDSMKAKEIVGTIAGDDTVFIAVNSKGQQSSVLKRLSVEFAHGE